MRISKKGGTNFICNEKKTILLFIGILILVLFSPYPERINEELSCYSVEGSELITADKAKVTGWLGHFLLFDDSAIGKITMSIESQETEIRLSPPYYNRKIKNSWALGQVRFRVKGNPDLYYGYYYSSDYGIIVDVQNSIQGKLTVLLYDEDRTVPQNVPLPTN